jgi:hypothetical protein
VIGKVLMGVLGLSLANLAVARYSGSEPVPDAATRQAMADACRAAVPQPSRAHGVATVRIEPLAGGHYWITLVSEGGSGAHPIACDLVRDQDVWRAESVTVIEW